MILSMTGYGKAVVAYKEKKINVEVKSLNSKSLDLSARIAPLYREKEMEIRRLLAQKLERGKVDINEAIEKLTEFRKQEGAALQKKFTEKIDNIANLLKSIEPFEKSRVPKIREKIIDGLKQIPEVDYDKNRLEQELIYYIEKLDINEEKQRLTNHLKYFHETMKESGHGVGKKLGFIAQEMGREINTTGSKSNQAEMQNIVVKMKDELEQIKEQVLNAL